MSGLFLKFFWFILTHISFHTTKILKFDNFLKLQSKMSGMFLRHSVVHNGLTENATHEIDGPSVQA